jgi:TRAP-type C4-dicarboxylate transport system substrate-binding protein
MERKKDFFTLIVLFSISFYLLLGAFNTAQAESKTIKWIFATTKGASHASWAFFPHPRFQNKVKEATKGRLELQTKVDLMPASEIMFGVIDGRADIGFTWIPYVSGTFPQMDFASFPFFYKDGYEYEKVVNDPRMKEILSEMYNKAGLVRLFESPATSLDALWGNKPVRTVKDFKGLKVRSSGLLPTFSLQMLGAAPLTMQMAELSDALSRGTVDAVLTSTMYGAGVGMMDVTKYISYWPIQSFYGNTVFVNKKSWDALPPDLQETLIKVGQEMQNEVFYAAETTYSISNIVAAGAMEIVKPSPEELQKAREMTQPVFDKWVDVAGPRAPEILEICKKYASGSK